MEFTTRLRLHSQAIRLDAEATPSPPAGKARSHDGPFTLEGREPRSRGLEGATRRSTSRPPRYATLPAAVTAGASAMGLSPFTRSYWGNPR
jgi:hypothetical protein